MHKLLIANRGEIAVRIARAARELGITTVAACSEADTDAVSVRYADERVVIGPAPAGQSYLNVEALLGAARQVSADAVHPGYGFLSENADFAERVESEGMTWVGPSPHAIRLMGDKARARSTAQQVGVPTVAGSDGPVADPDAAREAAATVGFPVAIKAAAGGGGRGIRVVGSDEELESQLPVAQAEARAAFGSPDVYIERFVPRARHIEVQVFGDGTNFIHMGTRDCSMQRRRQKVIEEAGELGLPEHVERGMTAAAVSLAEAVKYCGAGTVEFLYDAERAEFAFIEMNTRIQVEHPVTEMVWGFDLVQEQLLVAQGQPLSKFQEEHRPRGHAIEVRLNAEDPHLGFLPSPGPLERFRLPGGPFVRVDSGYEEGGQVPPFYDSLLAKIIVWGATREEAIVRLSRALGEVEVTGVSTTVTFLRQVLDLPEFRTGTYHTRFLEDWMQQQHKGSR
ncbi:MAG TPA: acetyl-CoA carboxylase biotin carboxylase subunit [Intrasporangium sp.]|nr:acetyl-CoA carboxylase biotin carboxylase subunit [Intrasporangium sp.]HET7399124.1 acetyl-CoA carboxylase biotin carboxylase subunit [Intrasporangium sp.]